MTPVVELVRYLSFPPSGLPGAVCDVGSTASMASARIVQVPNLGTYVIHERLGKGGFGSVSVAVLSDDEPSTYSASPERIAVKEFKDYDSAAKEIKFLQSVPHHDHVLTFLGAAGFPGQQRNLMLAVELCDVSLSDLIDVVDVSVGQYAAYFRRIVRHVASGIAFIHGQGCAHRDIKPGNILLVNVRDLPRISAKIGDFGTAREGDLMLSLVGTTVFLPPEINPSHRVNPHTKSVDLWSLGVTILCMFVRDGNKKLLDLWRSSTHLFCNCMVVIKSIFAEAGISDMYDIVAELLVEDPQRRTSAKDLVDRPSLSEERVEEHRRALLPSPRSCAAVCELVLDLSRPTPVYPTTTRTRAALLKWRKSTLLFDEAEFQRSMLLAAASLPRILGVQDSAEHVRALKYTLCECQKRLRAFERSGRVAVDEIAQVAVAVLMAHCALESLSDQVLGATPKEPGVVRGLAAVYMGLRTSSNTPLTKAVCLENGRQFWDSQVRDLLFQW